MMHTNTTKKTAGAMDFNDLHTDTNGAHFCTTGAIEQAHDGNAIANQLARLALAGHTVHRGAIGDFTACKHGMSRYCKDFAELQAFARQVGVKP